MVVFTLLVEVTDSVPTPPDVILMQILDVICDHDLAPLIGKHHHNGNNTLKFVNNSNRAHIEYDYARAESRVMSDWVGANPCFIDMQFEKTFRIKQNIVDIIMSNLAKYYNFWTKTICRAGTKKRIHQSSCQVPLIPEDDSP